MAIDALDQFNQPAAPTAAGHLTNKAYVDAGLALKANIASPTFTGTPKAPTATAGTNTTQLATTAFVQAALADAGAGVPAHTHAIGDVTSLQTSLDAKAPKASPAFTGNPTAPTQAAGNNSTRLATTAFVQAAVNAAGSGFPTPQTAAGVGQWGDFVRTVEDGQHRYYLPAGGTWAYFAVYTYTDDNTGTAYVTRLGSLRGVAAGGTAMREPGSLGAYVEACGFCWRIA